MKFIALESEKFRKFADKSPYKSFYQTPEIAKLREGNGWASYYFGVEEKGKLLAAAMVVAKPTFLGKSTYYIPGGPLLDYEDMRLTNFFMKNLKNYAKTHNGYILHIEPYYEKIERDRDGKLVENGFNHQKADENLKSLGFKPLETSDNPKYLFTLDLRNKTEKELFASFKQNTRNLINRAKRHGVKVRELKREELNIFKQITESTSARRHFSDKPLSYYETMYDLFHAKGEVKFLIAEVRRMAGVIDNVFFKGNDRLARSEAYIPDATEKAARRADFHGSPAYDAEGELVGPEKDMSDRPPAIPLSAAMFMLYGNEVIYLFSGSDEKYMKEYNAQYTIQWHMIKHALKNGFKTYNFYGIKGLPDPKTPGYGIYRFKKGFTTPENGRVVELLGAYELPLNVPFYYLHKLFHKLKHH